MPCTMSPPSTGSLVKVYRSLPSSEFFTAQISQLAKISRDRIPLNLLKGSTSPNASRSGATGESSTMEGRLHSPIQVTRIFFDWNRSGVGTESRPLNCAERYFGTELIRLRLFSALRWKISRLSNWSVVAISASAAAWTKAVLIAR
jgi:hypothetical protein